ncbi:MAG: hypothetical protein ACM3KH_00055 [Thiobacillus sp.]
MSNRYQIETYPKSYEQKKSHRLTHKIATTALATTLLLTAGGCAALAKNAPEKPKGTTKIEAETPKRDNIDPTIVSVTIHKGANIRTRPSVADVAHGDSDNLVVKTDEEIVIKAHNDIGTEITDGNGEWYEIPVSDIPTDTLGKNGEELKSEPGKTVWVNKQRATAERDPYAGFNVE